MTSLPRYRAIPATDLIVRPLADITLVYHRPSGQTHMVASPVPEILAALEAFAHPPENRDNLCPVRPEPVEGPSFTSEEEKGFDKLSPNGSPISHDALDPFSRESGNPVSPSTDGTGQSPGLLLSQENSIEAILGHLTTHYDLGDPAEARAAIETHLAEMAALGLVRRA